MPQILLVNPRSRKKSKTRKKTMRKKRRTAAQKAATKKMIAANRRRSNPRKRKATTRRKPARRRTTAVKRRRRSTTRRRNPALSMNSVKNQVTEAGIGAIGALGLDVVQGYLPIPANLKGGLVGTGVKALLAIGMGVVATKTKVVKYSTAAKMANGALVVVLHDELKKQVATYAPGIQMGEYLDSGDLGYYGSGYNPGGDFDENETGFGTYLPELSTDGLDMDESGMGEYMDDFSVSAQDY